MQKRFMVSLLVASLCTSSAFANNIINKLVSKHSQTSPSIIKTHKTSRQSDRPYTDFSGTWIPNCGNGPGDPTVIVNDAEFISLDGDESRIGQGLQGKYESNDDNAAYEHTSFEWNKNGSELVMKSVDVAKFNSDNSSIYTDISKLTITMKNGQINVDGKFTMFDDVTQTEQPMNIHCVLTKKQ